MQTKYLWTLSAVIAIWLAVLLMSLFTPDFVSGGEQDHIKFAAIINWLWGALATVAVLRMLRHQGAKAAENSTWVALGVGVVVIWTTATLVSLLVPDIETGTDPTRIPLAGMMSPIVAMVLTRYLAEFLFEGLGEKPVEVEEEPIS
jgi:amino acid transporter